MTMTPRVMPTCNASAVPGHGLADVGCDPGRAYVGRGMGDSVADQGPGRMDGNLWRVRRDIGRADCPA
ncbi:hypothetical protein [Paracoccus sp. Ld10]|uniref:hypothetical protein n=1 Tax=Paracoccus sp. Ld10 TaxID=649158 RepID=UPI0038709568